MAWFRRKDDDSMDPQVLLARSHEATPLEPTVVAASATTPSATTGFRMTVEDVFSISGRGTVVTGRVEAGSIATGSTVRLTRPDGSARDVEVTGIEAFRKVLDTASVGANVGLLLREMSRSDVGPGDVLSS